MTTDFDSQVYGLVMNVKHLVSTLVHRAESLHEAEPRKRSGYGIHALRFRIPDTLFWRAKE